MVSWEQVVELAQIPAEASWRSPSAEALRIDLVAVAAAVAGTVAETGAEWRAWAELLSGNSVAAEPDREIQCTAVEAAGTTASPWVVFALGTQYIVVATAPGQSQSAEAQRG